MTQPMTWHDIGVGQSISQWSAVLAAHGPVDPYAAWFDCTAFDGVNEYPPNVILELSEPLTVALAYHLMTEVEVVVLPFYWQGSPGRWKFVTGWYLDFARLVRAVAAGSIPNIKRYELSTPILNETTARFHYARLSEDLRRRNGLIDRGHKRPPRKARPTAPAKKANLSVREQSRDGAVTEVRTASLIVAAKHLAVIGFVDYGCAFANEKFRSAGNQTRVQAIWNQERQRENDPFPRKMQWFDQTDFMYGRTVGHLEMQQQMTAHALAGSTGIDEDTCYLTADYESIRRDATHGTHVMDVAAGSPSPWAHFGTPPEARPSTPIVFAQLPRTIDSVEIAGLLRANVLDALHWIADSIDAEGAGVINLSYGTFCGPHDGSSTLEMAIDELIETHRSEGKKLQVVVPSGNCGGESIHAQVLVGTGQTESLRFDVAPDDPSDTFVEIWIPDGADVQVRLSSPNGETSDWVQAGCGQLLKDAAGEAVAAVIFPMLSCQSDRGRLVLVALAPSVSTPRRPTDVPRALRRAAAPYGNWRLDLENIGSGSALIDAWCERDDPSFGTEGVPRQVRFTNFVEPTGTLNSIAHGRLTYVVGGYEVHATTQPGKAISGPVSRYSGTGPGRGLSGRARHPIGGGAAKNGPEALAPCDVGGGDPGIDAAAVFSGASVRLAGTSVAAAYATRAIVDAGFDTPAFSVMASEQAAEDEPHPDDLMDIPRIPIA